MRGIRRGVSILRGLAFAGLAALAGTASLAGTAAGEERGPGDLGVIVERSAGRIAIVETTGRTKVAQVEGLGDLSHASVVFSRDERYAYVFGRDGGLSKLDLLEARIDRRIMQAGNSIGGAISEDGRLIAVANYEPGGVRVFDAETLEPVADIPAHGKDGALSKVVGLVDTPGQRFVFALYDAGELWIADFSTGAKPAITRFAGIGKQPYDGMVTPDGRYYLAGLFGEDGLAVLDLQAIEEGPRRVLEGYGRGEEALPVYKMPHLEGWSEAGGNLFIPAVGHHALLVVEPGSWREIAQIPLSGQPVFAVARPDGRQVWVNFAHPANDVVEVIDVARLEVVQRLNPGPAVMHMAFTRDGKEVWLSVRDEDRVDVYDSETFERLASLAVEKPSGIFFTARAHRIGL
jgi:protein NirF